MHRRHFLRTALCAGAALAARRAPAAPPALSPATWQALPRWRGFNLLGLFMRDRAQQGFLEADYDWIAGWGFNFVRLPCDYRCWTTAPGRYLEAPLKELDQAIGWARARGIHTLLNLHRAPGYTVAQPPEKLNLWSDGADGIEARAQFAAQWKMFAERYRGIPSRELSFNLVNEPAHIAADKYVRACAAAVTAIRAADPDRLVLADGLDWGSVPVPELKPLQVGQCTRGYAPHQLTHYQASWVKGSSDYPVPTWPLLAHPAAFLYGDIKKEWQTPLVLRGSFPAGTRLTLRLTKLSYAAHLVIKADDRVLLQKEFSTTAAERQPALSDMLQAELPAAAREISVALDRGDWLTWQELILAPLGGQPAVRLQAADGWGRKQGVWTIGADGRASSAAAKIECDRDVLWTKNVVPWIKLRDSGVGVMVGEWGCHNRTPHAVVLAWMRDCLANWQRAGFGWALWNLRGSFGILDSDRRDVTYENHYGHRLDRRMLELLQAN